MRGHMFTEPPEAMNESRLALQGRCTLLPDVVKRPSMGSIPSTTLQDPRISDLDRLTRFYLDYCEFAFKKSI